MGRAVSDAYHGVAPAVPAADPRSRHATQATTVLAAGAQSHRRPPARGGAVAPRRPRAGGAGGAGGPGSTGAGRVGSDPREPAVVAPPRGGTRRGRRLLGALLALLVLGAVIAAVVVATAPAPTKITLRRVVYSDVERAAESLQRLVSENTK
jgi:hypothetical protein